MRTIEVSFEHWRYLFTDDMLTRYGSRYFSRKRAGEIFLRDIYKQATRVGEALHFGLTESQVLCGNEAFPEAALADPLADLEVWDEWRAGIRCYPYPGRYSRLGITRQDDKTSSTSSVGVLGEIVTGFLAQEGVSPWVLVRVVRRWPDFIFSHRDGTYSFVESKAFTQEPSGGDGLRARVLDALVCEAAVDALQQLNSDPFGRVWFAFTHIAQINPRLRLSITFLELNVPNERRSRHGVHAMPAAVVEGLAERAVNQAVAQLLPQVMANQEMIPKHNRQQVARDLGGLAQEELAALMPEIGTETVTTADREALHETIDQMVGKAVKRRRQTKEGERSGRRFLEAKLPASEGRLATLRHMGDHSLLLADLSAGERDWIRDHWHADWSQANVPWGRLEDVELWRCGGAVICLGNDRSAGSDIGKASHREG